MSVPVYLLEARRWLQYAMEDLTTAELLRGDPQAPPRQACWLAQQAAEKALKGLLVFLVIDFPRTHDLDALRSLLPPNSQTQRDHPVLSDLTTWAVSARYPGEWPEATADEGRDAVEQAQKVVASVRSDLTRHGFVERST